MKKIYKVMQLSLIVALCNGATFIGAEQEQELSQSLLERDEQAMLDEIACLIKEINETIASFSKKLNMDPLKSVVDTLAKEIDRQAAEKKERPMPTRGNKAERERTSMTKEIYKAINEIKSSLADMQKILKGEDSVAWLNIINQVVKASRPDAVVLADPSYPPTPYDSVDLAAIRQCLCELKTKIDQIIACICLNGDGVCFPDVVTAAQIDATNQSVIQWLKSIMKDIRGVCSNCCPIPTPPAG